MTLTTLDPVEQEIQELPNRLRLEGPKPRQICGGEANQIIRFLRENSTVTQFASSGIERFLANAACLPDGRTLLVYRGKPTRQAAYTFLPRASAFGAYLKHHHLEIRHRLIGGANKTVAPAADDDNVVHHSPFPKR